MKTLPFLLLLILIGFESVYGQDTIVNSKAGTFTDSRDDHVYKWVNVGNQTWMAENLAYLPKVSPPTYSSSINSHYYVYDYLGTDPNEAKTTEAYTIYGVLYNWAAANKSCPIGWHLPTDDEWNKLDFYLSTNSYGFEGSGTKIGKALAFTSLWYTSEVKGQIGNDQASNNKSGFSAIASGFLKGLTFTYLYSNAHFWSFSPGEKWYDASMWGLTYSVDNLNWSNHPKSNGSSVRCLKND